MNSILPSDQEIHKAPGVDLHDVWEDIPPPPIPPRVPFKKDLTFGRARGNTWGYQGKSHSRKRLDKFFYTGLVDMVMLDEVQDRAGKVGRLGIGVKTKVTALEWVMTLGEIMYLNPSDGIHPGRLVELDAWISDHFAIAIGVRVKKEEERGSVVHGGP
jgi:tyrosyl-DNA phosphodiesterase 2